MPSQPPVSGSIKVPKDGESYLLVASWAPGWNGDVGEGVESPVFGKEGAAQYSIILQKPIPFGVFTTFSAQTPHPLPWLTLAPSCSF